MPPNDEQLPADTGLVVVVIFDISGYTKFVNHRSASRVHSEYLISQLLEAVVDAVGDPLAVRKFEGDAVLVSTAINGNAHLAVDKIWRQMVAAFDAFAEKRLRMMAVNMCHCSACNQLDQLRLKAVADYGQVMIQRIKQFEDFVGEPLIVVHRLLKNRVKGQQYALLTERFCALDDSGPWQSATPHVERDPDLGAIKVRIASMDDTEVIAPTPAFWFKRILASFKLAAASQAHYYKSRLTKAQPPYRNLPMS